MIDPYARITFRGRLMDNATAYALMQAEEELGYELTIVQGVGGAPASGGTHLGKDGEGGRAADLADWDYKRKVRVLRDLGFAAWYRAERPGVWGPHIHAVLIFQSRSNRRGIAPLAFDQIRKYDAGQDGLSGSSRDPNPYRPNHPAVYTLREFRKDTVPPLNDVQKLRNKLVEARHALGDAIAHCKDAEGRTVVQNALPKLRDQRRELTRLLEHLPKR